jgi:hypothetical protein
MQLKQIVWFVTLWLASVATISAVALLIRTVLV